MMKTLFKQYAGYNAWMNLRLLLACGQVTDEQREQDLGLFFKSLHGTWNHLVVANQLWMHRFSTLAAPCHPCMQSYVAPREISSLSQIVCENWEDLTPTLSQIDTDIQEWLKNMDPLDLEKTLHYQDTSKKKQSDPLASMLLHFFNHQTHHRGQITTALSQLQVDCGVTDLAAWVRMENST